MERSNRNNVILIGFMGSGKTSVGKVLAGKLGYRFLDSDALIVQEEKQSIPAIFEVKGEAYFRDKETELLNNLKSSLQEAVLSTGGGIPIRPQNRELLKQLGFVVFLKTSDETILRRLRDDTSRPLLTGEDPKGRVEQLQREREPMYTAAAHFILDTDKLSPEKLADRIIGEYNRVAIMDKNQ